VQPRGDSIFVSDTSNSRVQIFGPTGNLLRVIEDAAGADPLRLPTGFARSDQADLFVVDHGARKIRRYDSSLIKRASGGAFTGPPQTTAHQGLAVLGNDLFHASWFDHLLRRLTFNLQVVQTVGGQGTAAGQFRHPVDVAVAPVCP
jgi:hypothetical protein